MAQNSREDDLESKFGDTETLVDKPSRWRTFWTKYKKPIYYILGECI